MATLCELLKTAASKYNSKTALAIQRGYRTERWSYDYLHKFSERLAVYLEGKGLNKGDRVLLWAPNMPEWVGLYFGCLRFGIILVPLDVLSSTDFVVKIKEETGARCLFVSRLNQNQVPELGIPVQCLEDLSEELDWQGQIDPLPQPSDDDTAVIMFTSGTTGEPKGVILTHKNIVSNVLSSTEVVSVCPGSRVLSILPLSHMLEQTAGLLGFLKCGATVIYPASRQPTLIFRTLREQHITNMVLVPQVLQLFWNAIEREVKKRVRERTWQRLLSISARLPLILRRQIFRQVHRQLGGCLQFIICGGAYLDPELARRWELLGVAILQGYGTTEAAPIITVNSLTGRRSDSLGKSLPRQEVKVAPDGEILIRGANITTGYWQNSQATTAAFDDGWYKTGDLGYVDDAGYLYFRGRKKDMISLPNGMNVYAQDVEAAFNSCSAIQDTCVIGVFGKSGEVHIHAVLLLSDPTMSPEEIVAQANGRLAEYQRVQGVTVWPLPDFPRTHTLKVKKQEILEFVQKTALEQRLTVKSKVEEAAELPILYRLLSNVTDMPTESIQPDSTLGEDLKLDSLGRVELLAAVETELGAYVDDSQVSAATTVEELEALIASAGDVLREYSYVDWPLNRFVCLIRVALQSFLLFPLLRFVTRLKVEGMDNLPELRETTIIATNHQSHLDTAVVLAALPLKRRLMTAVAAAADFWFAGGWVKKILATLAFNAFAFSRSDLIRPTMEYCCHLLDNRWSILIYPEGTRSTTGEIGPFKLGTGLIAVELGVPVIPVHIKGTYEILPKGKLLPRRGSVVVRFGKALRFPLSTPYIEATSTLEEAVKALAIIKPESTIPLKQSRQSKGTI